MKSEPVVLEEGSAADVGEVMAVMADSFDPRFGEAWTSAQCAGLLPLDGVWLTLARSGGEALGFALARLIADEAELLLLAVKRKAQRRGIGKMLLDRFAEIAARKGATRLHLEVREGNHAVNIYLCSGFAMVGRRRDYYRGTDGQVHDALTLARSAGIRAE